MPVYIICKPEFDEEPSVVRRVRCLAFRFLKEALKKFVEDEVVDVDGFQLRLGANVRNIVEVLRNVMYMTWSFLPPNMRRDLGYTTNAITKCLDKNCTMQVPIFSCRVLETV